MMDREVEFEYIDGLNNKNRFILLDKFSKDNKDFIIYQKKDTDELYASFYEVIGEDIILIPITNEDDYKIVDDYLEQL